VVKVIWYKVASPTLLDRSVVFARWRQNVQYRYLGPRESAPYNGISIGSAVLHGSPECPAHRHADRASCDVGSNRPHLREYSVGSECWESKANYSGNGYRLQPARLLLKMHTAAEASASAWWAERIPLASDVVAWTLRFLHATKQQPGNNGK